MFFCILGRGLSSQIKQKDVEMYVYVCMNNSVSLCMYVLHVCMYVPSDSPVREDSFTVTSLPEIINPSAGILSPAFSTRISPTT